MIKLQSIYRGNKTRQKLNNIFYKLPIDVQKIVLYYLNDKYIVKMNNKIQKIIVNKLYKFHDNRVYNIFLNYPKKNFFSTVNNRFVVDLYTKLNEGTKYQAFLKQFNYLIYLLQKYHNIINYTILIDLKIFQIFHSFVLRKDYFIKTNYNFLNSNLVSDNISNLLLKQESILYEILKIYFSFDSPYE